MFPRDEDGERLENTKVERLVQVEPAEDKGKSVKFTPFTYQCTSKCNVDGPSEALPRQILRQFSTLYTNYRVCF